MSGTFFRYGLVPFVVGVLIMGGIWFVVGWPDDDSDSPESITQQITLVGSIANADATLAEGEPCSFDPARFGVMTVRTSDYRNLTELDRPDGIVQLRADGTWQCAAIVEFSYLASPFYVFDVDGGYRWVVSAEEMALPGFTLPWPGEPV